VCDSLCALGPAGTLFAKNSDRPPSEVQLVAPHRRRPPRQEVRTQYLSLPDQGAAETVLARPTWLWGAEHGVNEHRVAVGNQAVHTSPPTPTDPPALLGMDLVRLGLERARSADDALQVITDLVEAHGQGGVANAYGEAYSSSFLIADPSGAWELETVGRRWAARPVTGHAAMSNRISIGTDWARASADVGPGSDFDDWRDHEEPTAFADVRLAASATFLAGEAGNLTPRLVAAHLRDHGHGPWGAPGCTDDPHPPPAELLADFTGISVCMHVRGVICTTSSMIVELPRATADPARAWVATGTPCVSIFVPVLVAGGDGWSVVPLVLAEPALWGDVERLRARVEADPDAIGPIRAMLDPIEAQVWDEADALGADLRAWTRASEAWGDRVAEAIAILARHPAHH